MTDKKEEPCPLADMDQRLDDVHRLWHRADRSYFRPEEFRVDLNALIQTARTVTFILQKNKAKIPDFDRWYATHQDVMKSDSIMRWLVEARNEIEKQGDLSTKSVVRAEIIASHLDEFPKKQIEANLFDDVAELFKQVPRFALQEQVLKHGVLQIERKWIHDKLPTVELLEALAHCYGVMAKVVADAHRQMGLNPPSIEGEPGRLNAETADGRLPCMKSPSDTRTLRLHLADGSTLSTETRTVKLDVAGSESHLLERYGELPSETSEGETSFEKECHRLFNIGRLLMEKDYYHDPMTFIFRNGEIVQPMITPTKDRQEKYLLSRSVANEISSIGGDAVVTVGEVWRSDPLPGFQYPSEQKDRKEGLLLTGVNKEGEVVCLTADVQRVRSRLRRLMKKPEKVELGPTVVANSFVPFFLKPTLDIWGLDLPVIERDSESGLTDSDE